MDGGNKLPTPTSRHPGESWDPVSLCASPKLDPGFRPGDAVFVAAPRRFPQNRPLSLRPLPLEGEGQGGGGGAAIAARPERVERAEPPPLIPPLKGEGVDCKFVINPSAGLSPLVRVGLPNQALNAVIPAKAGVTPSMLRRHRPPQKPPPQSASPPP
ncbi:hypothetical protein SAMN02745223_00672 [Devosia limi DSM 17137]|uniref:Uncharacterized protein n=1 Tax=Devosia limi DSM 17137 TaxID=1121477 RepID=A0A1M4UVC2_9HYPH|nr:hypothetical protein SAMN02745223_00672 [Devosia limi DSM 17137]